MLLDLSNHATKKDLEHATGIDTPDLYAQKAFKKPTIGRL